MLYIYAIYIDVHIHKYKYIYIYIYVIYKCILTKWRRQYTFNCTLPEIFKVRPRKIKYNRKLFKIYLKSIH